jgi:MoxR-like ATPase
MAYRSLFSPPPPQPASAGGPGDRRDGGVYSYTPRITLALDVALATGRPLLVRGPSGGGKSSLARNAARVLGWRYYEQVISSRTQAQDLLWEIDHLRRLQDAQIEKLREGLGSYIRPGVLWWAFDRASARQQAQRFHGEDRGKTDHDPNLGDSHERAVVLLDEIDKADPDVPNNLLVPLGSLQFQVLEGAPVKTPEEQAPLVVITTNDERELPPAFLRRCVELVLEPPDRERLIEIGRLHYPKAPRTLLEALADLILSTPAGGTAQPPSIAEYLDTVRACGTLGVEPGTEKWDSLVKVTVWKHGRAGKAGE